MYVVKTGCQWRQLPGEFGAWMTIYSHYRRMRQRGSWDRVLQALREQARVRMRRSAAPSVAIVDSHAVRTTSKKGGMTPARRSKGRKRHIAVDTQGFLLAVIVHLTGLQDRVAARAVLIRLFALFTTIRTAFADGGYTGTLAGWTRAMFGWTLAVVKRTEKHRFAVLPRRWIVERTFAWLKGSRRLSKDYEVRTDTSETMIKIAMTHLLLKRLA